MDLRTRPKSVNEVEVASVPTALCSTRRYRSTNTRYTEALKITTRMDELPPALTNPRRRQKDNRPTGISGRITPRENETKLVKTYKVNPEKCPSEDHEELVEEAAIAHLLAEPAYPQLFETPTMLTKKKPLNNAHTAAQLAQTSVCLRRGTRT